MLSKALVDVPLFVAGQAWAGHSTTKLGQIPDHDVLTPRRSLGNGLVGERSRLEAEARKLKREIKDIEVRCVTARTFKPPFPSRNDRPLYCVVHA
jgi:hypothetical protein